MFASLAIAIARSVRLVLRLRRESVAPGDLTSAKGCLRQNAAPRMTSAPETGPRRLQLRPQAGIAALAALLFIGLSIWWLLYDKHVPGGDATLHLWSALTVGDMIGSGDFWLDTRARPHRFHLLPAPGARGWRNRRGVGPPDRGLGNDLRQPRLRADAERPSAIAWRGSEDLRSDRRCSWRRLFALGTPIVEAASSTSSCSTRRWRPRSPPPSAALLANRAIRAPRGPEPSRSRAP